MNFGLSFTDKPSAMRSKELVLRFRTMLNWFAATLAQHDIAVRPYTGDKPSHFENLPSDLQMATFANFARYAAICAETIRDGYPLTDDKAFLWRFIKRMQLHPTSDLFSLFSKEDVVEVYDLGNFVQIFRNLRFFSLCSYTLDEILCRPFWELYRRDPAITAKIIEMATKLANQSATTSLAYEGGKYVLEEIESPKLYQCKVENRFITPLFDENGKSNTAVHVIRVHAGPLGRDLSNPRKLPAADAREVQQK